MDIFCNWTPSYPPLSCFDTEHADSETEDMPLERDVLIKNFEGILEDLGKFFEN